MSTLELPFSDREAIGLGEGITLLRAFADTRHLMPLIEDIARAAPFRHLVTPGGQTMSVAMTNCGPLGWVSDRSGYRYSSRDPLTDRDWPALPVEFERIALDAAGRCGFAKFVPDACLVNRYSPGARLTARRRRTELRTADRLGVARPASELRVLRTHARREGPVRRIERWRRAGMGRSGAPRVSRGAANQARHPSAHRRLSLQPHVPSRTVVSRRHLRACSILNSGSPLNPLCSRA